MACNLSSCWDAADARMVVQLVLFPHVPAADADGDRFPRSQ